MSMSGLTNGDDGNDDGNDDATENDDDDHAYDDEAMTWTSK